MERESNLHGPRLDDELAREVDSLTHGAPVEAHVEEFRVKEDGGDDEPFAESLVEGEPASSPLGSGISYRDERARSELGRHLRPSIFPASRETVVRCAEQEYAPEEMVASLRALPDRTYQTIEDVWEALGGHHEARAHVRREGSSPQGVEPAEPSHEERADEMEMGAAPAARPARRFSFRFDWRYQLAALPLGITPSTAYVELDRRDGREFLRARFGVWLLETSRDNIAAVRRTGPYSMLKTIGPPRLSLADAALTFATNNAAGLSIRFERPVRAVEPLGLIRHPGLTVTVDDVDALAAALRDE